MKRAAKLLAIAHTRGIRTEVEGQNLVVKGPRRALTDLRQSTGRERRFLDVSRYCMGEGP